MTRILLAGVVLCAMIGILALAADTNPDKKPETPATKPTTKPAAPINKFCPVERENPVDPTVPTVVFEGKTIGFCCEDCPAKFKRDPKGFMKDLK